MYQFLVTEALNDSSVKLLSCQIASSRFTSKKGWNVGALEGWNNSQDLRGHKVLVCLVASDIS
jgi:hypothetical protein